MTDRSGWTQLAPGVYSDADGTCHLDAREMCLAVGVEPTEANQETIAAAAREVIERKQGIAVEVVDE